MNVEKQDAVIPPELLLKLEELKDVLTHQGIVQLHHGAGRRTSYRLRYSSKSAEGKRVQHSLELGTDSVSCAVQTLLDEWRASNPRPARKTTPINSPSKAELQDRALKRCLRQQAKAAGGGRSFQTKIGKMYDAAMNGSTRDAFNFYFQEPYLNPPKRGRPPKRRLW